MKKGKGLATLGEVAATHVKGGAAPATARETFPAALKRLRLEFKYTHRDVAGMCKVPTSRVRAWEDGSELPTRREFRRTIFMMRQIEYYPPEKFADARTPRENLDEAIDRADEAAERFQKTLTEEVPKFAVYQKLDHGVEALLPEEPPERVLVVKGDGIASVASDLEHAAAVAAAEEAVGKLGSSERTSRIREIAKLYLADAPTPEDLAKRLEAIKQELPRAQRRLLGIPSSVPALRPPPKGAVARTVKCPRCKEEVADLGAHRPYCRQRPEKSWESDGWRTCETCGAGNHHHWNVRGTGYSQKPPTDMVLRSAPCDAHRPAPKKTRSWELDIGDGSDMGSPPTFVGKFVSRSPAPSGDEAARKTVSSEGADGVDAASLVPAPPMAPDSGTSISASRGDGLDLVEKCLALAEMLWPTEALRAVMWFAAGIWNFTVEAKDEGRMVRAGGTGITKIEAVQALADALRAETKARARAAEDMARLLED